MPVELTFNAPTVTALNEQIMAYALAINPVWATPTAPNPDDAKYRSPLVEPKRGPGRPRKATGPTPVVADPDQEALDDIEVLMDEDEDDDEPAVDVKPDTVAAEKLKAEVMETLQGMFAAGKVKVVRHLLTKYGAGAKSFPEIDAHLFPAIKDALARGETA
jgi:hypothetical protein